MQKRYYVYFTAIFMTIPGDVSNSKLPSKLADKRVWIIIVIAVAGIIFGIWLFFISGYNSLDNSEKLPPNCYSLNAKQICPNS
ncbi:MAG: hypothetical protein ACRD97_05920 [Nitrososphaeraceae archaeon]